MLTRFLFGFVILFLIGCAEKDELQSTHKGYLSLTAQVDARIRMKGSISVGGYDLSIAKKDDAKFSFKKKVSELGSDPIALDAGAYQVAVSSPVVALPDFGTPTYGVSQDVSITAGVTTNTNLVCKQTNAGVKVGYSDAFKKYCTDNSQSYSTTIEQGGGKLAYASTETRAGYFNPGSVNVAVSVGGKTYTSTLTLAAQDLVNLSIDLALNDPAKIALTITGIDDVNARDEKITISLTPNTSAETLKLSEDFATLTVGSNTSTSGGGSSWGGNENFPVTSTAYNAAGAVKLGGTSSGGSITTKSLDLSANGGNVTVKVKVKGWTDVESTLLIKVGEVEKELSYTAVMSSAFEEVITNFPNAGTVSSKLIITSSKKRLFIDEVKVYN
jgi:hypothetical protein